MEPELTVNLHRSHLCEHTSASERGYTILKKANKKLNWCQTIADWSQDCISADAILPSMWAVYLHVSKKTKQKNTEIWWARTLPIAKPSPSPTDSTYADLCLWWLDLFRANILQLITARHVTGLINLINDAAPVSPPLEHLHGMH